MFLIDSGRLRKDAEEPAGVPWSCQDSISFEHSLEFLAFHNKEMKPLYFFVDMFIKTFGITEPTEKARRRAAFFIVGLIVLALLAAAGTALVLRGIMR